MASREPPRTLILASRSPQRRAILAQLGVSFEVLASGAEELEGGPPAEVAVENARRKAAAVAARVPAHATVLGVDTVVAVGNRIYGKPADRAEAGSTLRALAGRRHDVLSGLCVIEHGHARTAMASTTVEFRAISDALLSWYLDSEEWRERAGGYAIQGRGSVLAVRVEGDYLNVVGLPLVAVLELVPGLLPT
ncbi:MAG: Maf family protein [Solirubrobacteraceae bacterium]